MRFSGLSQMNMYLLPSLASSLPMSLLMDIGIVWPLRLAWAAGILPILIASLPFRCLNPFHEVVLGSAKRGKLLHSSSHKYTVPQRWFTHFYVIAVLWTSLLLVASWTYAYKMAPLKSEPFLYSTMTSHLTGGSHIVSRQMTFSTSLNHSYMAWKNVFLLVLMEIQVLRRLFESIYVFDYNPSARMHLLGYLAGLFYYAAAPLSLCCNTAMDVYSFSASQLLEYITRGKKQMQLQLNGIDLWKLVFPLLKLGWIQWFGAAIFFWGWIHQSRCHKILGSLRKNNEQNDKYVIPHGDWFEIVSSPHYLAEIVIYGGLLVASGGTELTIWLLFGFAVSNLGFAAAETHRWYLRKFDNYPRKRYAVVPLIC